MIFVFGSNLAGRHGKGAASYARVHYGAEYGVGKGPTGRAYALPTKDENLRTLPLEAIEQHWIDFVAYAIAHEEETFRLTPFGCGLAGYRVKDIAPMMMRTPAPMNVLLDMSWVWHIAGSQAEETKTA